MNSKQVPQTAIRHARLSLRGATCASCAFTIEHYARKLDDIQDIRVDASQESIFIDYTGHERVLDEITGLVSKIGYNAEVIEIDE